jgi:acyl-homoserine-lactone acylase
MKDHRYYPVPRRFRERNNHMLHLITAVLILVFTSGSFIRGEERGPEILWDKWGVPHIYGKTSQEMYYAFGRAQMTNHADLILKLYAQARGRAAEYFGEKYLESDRQVLLFDLPGLAEKSYNQQNAEYKSYLDAFVRGMNDYAAKNPGISEKFRQVLPVTACDVLAHTNRVLCLEFLASDDINNVKRLTEPGSNSLAISPSRSGSGNAMLVANPHLPWSDFFIWFEAHLNSPGISAYGAALVGMPVLTIAFNNNLGWTHTVNTIDASDRYELSLRGDGYLLDGKIVPFLKRSVTIKIKRDDGTMAEQKIEFRYSKQGPVTGEKGNKAYAIRIAGLNNTGIIEQYHKMATAKNLMEFESALAMLQNPMFNVVYADKAGNILYLFNGDVPVRTEGDFAFWRGTINGSDSRYIWEKIHPYKDLPRVLNPPAGFVQNCNDAPWVCTYPPVLDPGKFPPYMSSAGTYWRAQRAINMIKDNHSISFGQLVDYKLNTGMEVADRFLGDLLAAVKEFPDPAALKAAAILRSWDKKTECNDRGAILFAEWCDEAGNNMYEVPWDRNNPVSTPAGLKDRKRAVALLGSAYQKVTELYGSADIAWGDVYRFRMGNFDYPANGGPNNYGIFRTMYFAGAADRKKYAIAGDTYVAVTEFGEKVRAAVLLSYGNATQPGNKHIGDQLKMLSGKELRPALLTREDILKDLERREILDFEPAL